jgi:hypothetical protein
MPGGPLNDLVAVGKQHGSDDVSRFRPETGESFDTCFSDQVNEKGFKEIVKVVSCC